MQIPVPQKHGAKSQRPKRDSEVTPADARVFSANQKKNSFFGPIAKSAFYVSTAQLLCFRATEFKRFPRYSRMGKLSREGERRDGRQLS